MPVFALPENIAFPSPELAEESGLLAVGGDLSVERLLAAYENGIFPWFEENQPLLWWSPPQRMILFPGRFKKSKSLAQSIRTKGFELRIDTSFEEVVNSCATVERRGQDDTWITADMKAAYVNLHQLGYAHSFEIWQQEQLVGGLYGVSLGRAFFGESMFHKTPNASKAAFFYLHEFMVEKHFHFIDCQLYTDHLASLGAEEIERGKFLEHLSAALAYPDMNTKWTK